MRHHRSEKQHSGLPTSTFETKTRKDWFAIHARSIGELRSSKKHIAHAPDFQDAALDATAYAAFVKESRMKCAGATKLHR
jgi:hypothetical protein